MKDIGKILKNARENKEYTQKQVMELTGIHRKSLSGYENNVAEPDLSTFATLANLYGISADEAFGVVNRILLFLCFVLNSKFFLYLKNSMQASGRTSDPDHRTRQIFKCKKYGAAKSSIQIILRHHLIYTCKFFSIS